MFKSRTHRGGVRPELALTVLAVNTVGDGLRDTLDPRIARKM